MYDIDNENQELHKGPYLKKECGRSVSWPTLIVGKVSSQDQVTQTHPPSLLLQNAYFGNIFQTHVNMLILETFHGK